MGSSTRLGPVESADLNPCVARASAPASTWASEIRIRKLPITGQRTVKVAEMKLRIGSDKSIRPNKQLNKTTNTSIEENRSFRAM